MMVNVKLFALLWNCVNNCAHHEKMIFFCSQIECKNRDPLAKAFVRRNGHCSRLQGCYNGLIHRTFQNRSGVLALDGKTRNMMQEQVQNVIESIRPLLQADGGDIELVNVAEDTGVVSVRLQGACRGCPGAQMTLKMGVERHLKEKVPEVSEVVAVE